MSPFSTHRVLAGLGGVAALVLITAQGCTGRPPAEAEFEREIVLIFDPTIMDGGDREGLEQLLRNLGNAYDDIPQSSCVSVVIADAASAADGAARRDCFPYQESFGGEEIHATLLAAKFDSVRSTLDKAWSDVHSPAEARRPRSCILTAIERAHRGIQNWAEKGASRNIVVVSNLLEACSDWGDLNLERFIPSTPPARMDSIEVNLEGVSSITFVQVGSNLITDPILLGRVRRFWTQALERWHLPPHKIRFSEGIAAMSRF